MKDLDIAINCFNKNKFLESREILLKILHSNKYLSSELSQENFQILTYLLKIFEIQNDSNENLSEVLKISNQLFSIKSYSLCLEYLLLLEKKFLTKFPNVGHGKIFFKIAFCYEKNGNIQNFKKYFNKSYKIFVNSLLFSEDIIKLALLNVNYYPDIDAILKLLYISIVNNLEDLIKYSIQKLFQFNFNNNKDEKKLIKFFILNSNHYPMLNQCYRELANYSDFLNSIELREYIVRFNLFSLVILNLNNEEKKNQCKLVLNNILEGILLNPYYLPFYFLGSIIYQYLSGPLKADMFLTFINESKNNSKFIEKERILKELELLEVNLIKIHKVNFRELIEAKSPDKKNYFINNSDKNSEMKNNLSVISFPQVNLPNVSHLYTDLDGAVTGEEEIVANCILYFKHLNQDELLEYGQDIIVIFIMMRMYKVAISICDTFIEKECSQKTGDNLNILNLYYLKAISLSELNFLGEALNLIFEFKRLTNFNSEQFVCFTYLEGLIFEKMGKIDKANSCFKMVRDINPNYRKVNFKLKIG